MLYTIGEMAKLLDIPASTLRYYDTVSYTHLDVYKRQSLLYMLMMDNYVDINMHTISVLYQR